MPEFIKTDDISIAGAYQGSEEKSYIISLPVTVKDWRGDDVKIVGSTTQATRRSVQAQIDITNNEIADLRARLNVLQFQMKMINQMEA